MRLSNVCLCFPRENHDVAPMWFRNHRILSRNFPSNCGNLCHNRTVKNFVHVGNTRCACFVKSCTSRLSSRYACYYETIAGRPRLSKQHAGGLTFRYFSAWRVALQCSRRCIASSVCRTSTAAVNCAKVNILR